jgi:colanic acid/amylovoran biosynthesis protein
MRDQHESFRELSAMGIFDPARHLFSSDDAVGLASDALGDASLIELRAGLGRYIAVHLHFWRMPPASVERLVAAVVDAVDRTAERHGCNVLLIPMTFGSRPRSDRALLAQLQRSSRHPSRYRMAPDNLKPQQLKYLFAGAAAAVVSRHHAMVFSITSGVPCAAIVLDPYYHMKLQGVADDYSGRATLIPHEHATPGRLGEVLEAALMSRQSERLR